MDAFALDILFTLLLGLASGYSLFRTSPRMRVLAPWGIGCAALGGLALLTPATLPLLAGGLLAVLACGLLAPARIPAKTSALVGLMTGLAVGLHPLLAPLPLLLALAQAAVWPNRALHLLLGGLVAQFVAWDAGWLAYCGLAIPTTPYLLGALPTLAVLAASLAYHWRWWPTEYHLAFGLGVPALMWALAVLNPAPLLLAAPAALLALLKWWSVGHQPSLARCTRLR